MTARSRPKPDPLGPELRKALMKAILGTFGHSRYTQDSPLRPDVWMAWWEKLMMGQKSPRVDLILDPANGCPAGRVAVALEALLADAPGPLDNTVEARIKKRETAHIAYSRTTVQAKLTPDEAMTTVIAMSTWWDGRNREAKKPSVSLGQGALDRIEKWRGTGDESVTVDQAISGRQASFQFYRFAALASLTKFIEEHPDDREVIQDLAVKLASGRTPLVKLLGALGEYLTKALTAIDAEKNRLNEFENKNRGPAPRIHAAAVNREAANAIYRSRKTVKVDATHTLFRIDTSGIVWAVIDSGIDARHPAFFAHPNPKPAAPQPGETLEPRTWPYETRIAVSYDLTFLRDLLAHSAYPETAPELREDKTIPGAEAIQASWDAFVAHQTKEEEPMLKRLVERRNAGLVIGWDILSPLVRIPHDDLYRPPRNEHGTHVAGILAGGWAEDECPAFADSDELGMMGTCPEMRLVDIRAFDAMGRGHEDTVIEAIDLVRFMNREAGKPMIHGANLSLSVTHDVQAYGCGQTPVCVACNELVRSGVVVVAAAGNAGHEGDAALGSLGQSARDISITDPGNAELVITVGSTHRQSPHSYGVSYFSSRGPTADGRMKPDLVAPGEKICGPIPLAGNDPREATYKILDGTSMAAPHVSGIAALLMARNRELIGEPQRIKDILRRTATDLGRVPSFQGAGLVDALRAMQSL